MGTHCAMLARFYRRVPSRAIARVPKSSPRAAASSISPWKRRARLMADTLDLAIPPKLGSLTMSCCACSDRWFEWRVVTSMIVHRPYQKRATRRPEAMPTLARRVRV
jgi:hypothetical protein